MAEGGKVEGAGTAKSDSIPAKVDNGGFVVPAENEKAARYIRLKYLNTTTKQADLKGGDTPVKLSNGEHYFTPQEVIQLKAQGVNLDRLAPNAEEGTEKADGGYTIDPSGVLSAVQIGTGLYGASKLGSVPVDQLDKQYTDAGNRLATESQYGLSPVETSLAKRNIELNRRANLKNIQANAGGDAGTILANSAAAGLNADAADTALAVESDKLKNAKLNNYANWVAGKQQNARQLFEDKLGRFNKEEAVYGNTLGAGIHNAIETDRYNKALKGAAEVDRIGKAPVVAPQNWTRAEIIRNAGTSDPAKIKEYMASKPEVYGNIIYEKLPIGE